MFHVLLALPAIATFGTMAGTMCVILLGLLGAAFVVSLLCRFVFRTLKWPLLLLLLLLMWGAWYSRPVGVETLFPDIEPDLLDVMLIGHHDEKSESRSLRLEARTEKFDALWTEVRGLRFHRSPLNPIEQVLTFLDGSASSGRSLGEDDINLMYINFLQDNGQEIWRSEELKFWVSSWAYRDMDRNVELTLWMKDGKSVGQDLAHRLWELAA